ncbi:MAG: hypothetical protein DRQ45_08680, partial [Gammaproteobacteria bacterium]
MKCILHVGPPKTGSTSIQTFLRQNKEILLARGILALTDEQIPRKLPYFFMKNDKLTPWARRRQLDQPKRMEALRKETDSYIRKQIRKYKPDTLVLSSEGLSRLPTDEMASMRDYLRGFASETEILIYLRRSDFRILSAYKNRIRNKHFTGGIIPKYRGRYDEGSTIEELGKCFGPDNITPVISKDSHPDRDGADGHIEALLKVLFRDTDITPGDFILPERRNIAWD